MDIENLTEGMTIKNYKLLCQLLGEKVRTGEARQIQLREFERYFSFQRDGQKYIIDEIFDTPKAKAVKKNAEMLKRVERALLYLLKNNRHKSIGVTKNFIFTNIGFFNGRYSYKFTFGLDETIQEYAEIFGISEEQAKYILNKFNGRAFNKANGYLETTLKSMIARGYPLKAESYFANADNFKTKFDINQIQIFIDCFNELDKKFGKLNLYNAIVRNEYKQKYIADKMPSCKDLNIVKRYCISIDKDFEISDEYNKNDIKSVNEYFIQSLKNYLLSMQNTNFEYTKNYCKIVDEFIKDFII